MSNIDVIVQVSLLFNLNVFHTFYSDPIVQFEQVRFPVLLWFHLLVYEEQILNQLQTIVEREK